MVLWGVIAYGYPLDRTLLALGRELCSTGTSRMEGFSLPHLSFSSVCLILYLLYPLRHKHILFHPMLCGTVNSGVHSKEEKEKGKMFPLSSSSNCANATIRSIVKKKKCTSWRKKQQSWSGKAMFAYWSRKNLYPICNLPHIQRQSWRLLFIPMVIWRWLAICARG